MKLDTALLASVAMMILCVAGIYAAVWWQVFRYNDCIKVGHSKLYCLFTIGK